MAAAPIKTVKATVSRGRTVMAEGKSFGPGQPVDLPAEDAARLRSLGFLTDPNVAELSPTIGPVFESQGNNITVEG